MNVRDWLAHRGPGYLGRRLALLVGRYGLSPARATRRVRECVARLAEFGCAPTFPTPGRVVARYPAFLRELQDAGAEIAVHSFDHIDLAACGDGVAQLTRAARVFDAQGIERHGFRCPYLSCTPELLERLPDGLYGYSSNQGVWWGAGDDAERETRTPTTPNSVVPSGGRHAMARDLDFRETRPLAPLGATAVYEVLRGFYRPLDAAEHLCIPWMRSGMVEIPVSLPDDLQLHDGLRLDVDGMAAAWGRMLAATHWRGEAFVLQFHPELCEVAVDALCRLLRNAADLRPRVWVARLRDINDWWRERATHAITVTRAPEGVRVCFRCSPRATVLARGLDLGGAGRPWAGDYRRLIVRELHLPEGPLPVIGLPAGAPSHGARSDTAAFLRDVGYPVRVGAPPGDCTLFLDDAVLAHCRRRPDLIAHIEASDAPLVRYWPWPDGARSALCITGDLDALSLIDYTYRFIARVG